MPFVVKVLTLIWSLVYIQERAFSSASFAQIIDRHHFIISLIFPLLCLLMLSSHGYDARFNHSSPENPTPPPRGVHNYHQLTKSHKDLAWFQRSICSLHSLCEKWQRRSCWEAVKVPPTSTDCFAETSFLAFAYIKTKILSQIQIVVKLLMNFWYEIGGILAFVNYLQHIRMSFFGFACFSSWMSSA